MCLSVFGYVTWNEKIAKTPCSAVIQNNIKELAKVLHKRFSCRKVGTHCNFLSERIVCQVNLCDLLHVQIFMSASGISKFCAHNPISALIQFSITYPGNTFNKYTNI